MHRREGPSAAPPLRAILRARPISFCNSATFLTDIANNHAKHAIRFGSDHGALRSEDEPLLTGAAGSLTT